MTSGREIPAGTTAAITVPATSANLGPGYDCLGLALGVRDVLRVETVPVGAVTDDAEVTVVGEGADDLSRDGSHLVVRAMRAAFERMGVSAPGLRLRCENRIPQSRGMGSSSAAIVGGIGLARALLADGADLLPDHEVLALANQLEGHPDNVAPALYGGLVVSGVADDQVWAVPAPVAPRLSAVVLVPPYGVRTEAARGLLPPAVPHTDAAANTGRAALLVAALGSAPGMLWRATEDFLHQRYREPAMPESLTLVERLRADGLAATISGAGPSVLVLCGDGECADRALAATPTGWSAVQSRVEPDGVRSLERPPR